MERITFLQKEISDLKNILIAKEKELSQLKKEYITLDIEGIESCFDFQLNLNNSALFNCTLSKWAIERYSRQILLPEIGVSGQEKICAGSVLIVGLGGLGCPAAAYLAGAGVGEIGLVDYDTVALANIHRQILHEESDVHMSKVMSAVASLRKLNSHIKITPYNVQLTPANALDIVSKYQVVLDCTDNVPSRYLLGDVCILAKVPLVSGSALKMEGQLSVYGYRAENNPKETNRRLVGPCYRCVFHQPPPAEAVGSCSAQGVVGPVPGMIGCLQALEAIKILVGVTHDKLLVARMLIFDGEDMTLKTVRLRARGAGCAGCGESAGSAGLPLLDYEQYCNAAARDDTVEVKILESQYRKTAQELARDLNEFQRLRSLPQPGGDCISPSLGHLLVDVRSESEFAMCRIDGSVNYPLERLSGDSLEELLKEISKCSDQVVFICRRGNDSQIAANKILDCVSSDHKSKIRDLAGGLHAWSQYVDHNFPVY